MCTVKARGLSPLACVRSAIVILALLVAPPRAIASNESDEIGSYPIGHVTVVLTDTSRNPDGSTPVTTAGRPLYLHIWYPTAAHPTQKIRYTWNNPVYNQNPGGSVYPGLPDTPARTALADAILYVMDRRS